LFYFSELGNALGLILRLDAAGIVDKCLAWEVYDVRWRVCNWSDELASDRIDDDFLDYADNLNALQQVQLLRTITAGTLQAGSRL
jgi:hypothetical protein